MLYYSEYLFLKWDMEIFIEIGIPDHLTCLMRNLYAGQEATVRTRHGRISSVQLLSRVQLFANPWITAHQASLSITNSRSSLKLTSIELVMPSNHLFLCRPLLQLPSQSFPASGSFPMSQLFASGGQSIGVSTSTSVLPMNTEDWSLGRTGWISLQSKGLSRVFSNTTVQKHQFFGAQLTRHTSC